MIIIFPAFNPSSALFKELVCGLAANKLITKIIVVNDGSDLRFNNIFAELSKIPNCVVLNHSFNQGKGAALKTAFAYCLQHFPNSSGVITADADGQHAPEDIIKIAGLLQENTNSLILGIRDLSQDVPWKSIIGNKLASFLTYLLTGHKIADTQCGLRAIPNQYLPELLEVKGQKYDYELHVLLYALQKKLPTKFFKIKTIYFQGNSGSHFHPFADSLRICKIVLVFCLQKLFRQK